MNTQILLPLLMATAGGLSAQAQTVIDSGHVDIGIAYESGNWDLHVHQEEPTEAEYEPDEAILQVGASAQTSVPADPSFSFLGNPGDLVWILPKSENPELLFLGIGSEELDPADWTGGITLSLGAVTGPGEFTIWDTDLFGAPLLKMNSGDGIESLDRLEVIAGSHAHFFYGFTAPGDYSVTFEASGLFEGVATASGPVTYQFSVIPEPGTTALLLTNEHCDLRVVYQPHATNKLAFGIRDSNRGISYEPDEVILSVTEAARLTLPGDIPPLGTAGAPLWVLPASQNPQLLYLGFSGDGLPQGVFDGPVDVRLRSTSGPGDFFIWQAGGTGALEFQMDTSDGISDLDNVPLFPGGHSHHNWGFTSNGIVTITLQAVGRRVGAATNETSLETTIVFYVQPVPDTPDSPFAQWQETHWPGATDPALIGAEADPDGDGRCNLLEYAFALDPKTPGLDGNPELSIQEIVGQSYAVLEYRQAMAATDLNYDPVVTTELTPPTWQSLTDQVNAVDYGSYQLVTVRDSLPLDGSATRFFQLRVSLKPTP
jgi:surface-anchored protein